MKSFEPAYLSSLVIPNRVVMTIHALGEFRGKQALWVQAKPQVLKHLLNVAMIESVESSSRMEQIEVGPKTLDRLLLKAEPPAAEDRSQAELAGYRDALGLIHRNALDMPFSENVVRQLHRELLKFTPAGGGDYKIAPNDIVEKDHRGKIVKMRLRTVEPVLVQPYMEALHRRFSEALDAGEISPLVLIPLYVHDFLCIHPFRDGNGRIARLLTVLLLHKQGYDVGRYISIERVIEETKSTYYESLALADVDWFAGRHNHAPFTEYILGVVLAAFRELERNTEVDLSHGAKKLMVQQAIASLPTKFRLSDLEAKCPLLKKDAISTALKGLKKDGKVTSSGRGPAARWHRT